MSANEDQELEIEEAEMDAELAAEDAELEAEMEAEDAELEAEMEAEEGFDPAEYEEPALEDIAEESPFVVRSNPYKKGSIEWIREEHEIVSEHLVHIEEDFEKFSRILKIDIATVRSLKRSYTDRAEQLRELRDAQDSLNTWIKERQGTYAWQLLEELKRHRQRILDFETEVKAWVEKPTKELYEKSFEYQRKFKRRIRRGFLGIFLSFAIGTIVNIILGFFGVDWIFKILGLLAQIVGIGNPFSMVPALLGGFGVVSWLTALTSYFRDYLKFRRELQEQIFEARYYLRAVKSLSTDKARVGALHAQVTEFLTFMSETLHKPWKIDEKWINYETSTIRPEALPTSLVVAKPIETEFYREVTKRIVEDFSSKNWRTVQFENLFASFEKANAMSKGTAEPKVNADPSLRNKIKDDISATPLLSNVGDVEVLDLAKHIQKQILPEELGFHVGSIKTDALASLDLSRGIFGEEGFNTNWTQFECEILGDASAWSNLAFSIEGLIDKLPQHNSVISYALIPERLRGEVKEPLKHVIVEKDEHAGVEVVVRIDVSAWIDPTKVKVFEAGQTRQTSTPRTESVLEGFSDVTVRG